MLETPCRKMLIFLSGLLLEHPQMRSTTGILKHTPTGQKVNSRNGTIAETTAEEDEMRSPKEASRQHF